MEQSSSDEDDIPGVAVDGAGNTVNQNTSIIKQKINNTYNYYTPQGNGAQHQGPNNHGGRNPPDDHPPPPFPQQAEGDKAPENPGNDPQNRGPNNQNHSDGQPPAAPDEHPPPYFPREAERDRAPENPDDDSEKTAIDDKSETVEIDYVSEYNDNKNAPSFRSVDSGIQDENSVNQTVPEAEDTDTIEDCDRTKEYVDNKSTNDSGIALESQECDAPEIDGQSTNDTENPSFYDEDTKVKDVASSSKVDSTIPNMKRRKTAVDRDEVQDRKIIKTEADNAGLGVFASFNVAERAEISIKTNKFREAIAELQQSENNEFRTKFLLSESMLRMGSTNTGTVIEELAEIVKFDSPDITEKYLLDLGIFMLNNGKIAKAMVLFACTAFISHDVFQMGMCIFRFSEAILHVPISKANKKAKANRKAKKKIAKSPLQKKFGLWSESFDQFDDLMNSMLNHMKIIGGAKLQKSQAFALNWMSVATYFIGHDFLSKAKEYSKKGLDISLKLGGVGYHVERTRSDLYFNYGRAICILGDKPSGVEQIETSIKIAKGVKDCPEDKKSDFDDNIKYKEKQQQYWNK